MDRPLAVTAVTTTVRRTVASLVAVAVLPVLAACGGGNDVRFSTAGSTASAAPGTAGTASAGPDGSSAGADAGTPGRGRVTVLGDVDDETRQRVAAAFPAFPPVVVPDVTALTGADARFTGPLARLATPSSGVSVVGARCDRSGTVVNRGSLTMVNNGDGSGSFEDGALTVTNGGDGTGTYENGALSISVAADGSGTLEDGALTIAIATDGSGTYEDGAYTLTLDGRGAGTLEDGALTLTVRGDGSGTYEDGSLTVVNNGDGSGTHEDGALEVVNNGDGTGSFSDGADSGTLRIDPLPPVPDLGRFPPVRSLVPVGKPCGTLIRLDSEVLFDFDSDTLRPAAGPILDSVAKGLAVVTVPVRVEGHTDAKGSDAYNLDLSRRRAAAVVAALTDRGVSTRLVAAGYGESRPVAPNTRDGADYPAGRQLNRRVEIVVPPLR